MTDEQFILTLQLALENDQLKKRITQLETEVENLKRELQKPERMTEAEKCAYWGIFGQMREPLAENAKGFVMCGSQSRLIEQVFDFVGPLRQGLGRFPAP